MNNCRNDDFNFIASYVAGTLPEEEKVIFAKHIEACDKCFNVVYMTIRSNILMKKVSSPSMPQETLNKILSKDFFSIIEFELGVEEIKITKDTFSQKPSLFQGKVLTLFGQELTLFITVLENKFNLKIIRNQLLTVSRITDFLETILYSQNEIVQLTELERGSFLIELDKKFIQLDVN